MNIQETCVICGQEITSTFDSVETPNGWTHLACLTMEDNNMSNFLTTLHSTLEEMIDEATGNLCMAVYPDTLDENNAIVMFMEYTDYDSMHAVMRVLYNKLSNKLGHPVSLCHNNPTDECILIHGHKNDTKVYYAEHCCKEDTIRAYHNWVHSNRTGYRDELVALFRGAEVYAAGCGLDADEILCKLNWDKDPQAQIIEMFLSVHN